MWGAANAKAVKSKMNKPRLLDAEEHGKTRKLYEEAFFEDSREFVDYYYQYKIRENRIYAIEDEMGEVVSMLHLNPYLMKMGKREEFGEYIVAVATQKKYRRQGMMRKLLKKALEDMRRVGEPFVFLMPAAEEIYRPFDFRFIYWQNRAEFQRREKKSEPYLSCRAAVKKDFSQLEQFANAYLARHYETFAFHTEDYFEQLLAEQSSQNGEVVLLMEQETIRGYFYTSFEDGAEVRELVAQEGFEPYVLPAVGRYLRAYERIKVAGAAEQILQKPGKQPIIMARAVHPQRFMAGLRAGRPIAFAFCLEDELLPENTGVYRLSISPLESRMEKTQDAAEFVLSIGEMTALAFGSLQPGDTKMPKNIQKEWEDVKVYAPVFLNEVV